MLIRSYILAHINHPHYFTDQQIEDFKKEINLSIDEEKLMKIARHLSDPTKLKIYRLLEKVKEMPVTDITNILDLSQSTASHALTDLRNLGIIDSHRCGKLICYFLKERKSTNNILAFLKKIRI